MNNNKPWVTVSVYVDHDTGELITKKEAEKHYIIIKKEENNDYTGHYNVKRWTNICEKSKQLKLW